MALLVRQKGILSSPTWFAHIPDQILFSVSLVSLTGSDAQMDRHLISLAKHDGNLLSIKPVELTETEVAEIFQNTGYGYFPHNGKLTDGSFGTSFKAIIIRYGKEREFAVQLRYYANIKSLYVPSHPMRTWENPEGLHTCFRLRPLRGQTSASRFPNLLIER